MAWDAKQYLTFIDHRLQPAIDLLARVQGLTGFNPGRIYDLGCGPGNITAHMKTLWPGANITGIDSSPDMLARAKEDFPQMQWLQGDVGKWQAPTKPDLIFSNAALHWLGDHDQLFPRLLANLPPGGVMAVQMPNNFARPTHSLVLDAAKKSGCFDQLAHLFKPSPTQTPDFYYEHLSPKCQHLDIWQTDYLQALEGDNPVADWTKGTWLRPFLDALDKEGQPIFEACYRKLIKAAYPSLADGKTLLPFKRLFILAIKK